MYAELLEDSAVTVPSPEEPDEHVYHLYVIEAPDRAELQDHLTQRSIGTRVHYPIPIHLQPAYRSLGSEGSFPVTEATAKRILSLPIYAGIAPEAVERTAEAVRAFYEG